MTPHPLDLSILLASNRWIGHVPELDQLVVLAASNDLVKGGLFLASLWWVWMQPHPDLARRRQVMLATAIGALAAGVLSRLLSRVLPFHFRPRQLADLGLVAPFPGAYDFDRLSCFPSDHAALALGLATGFFFLSRAIGLAFVAYAVILVCLPRLYLGLHWPSDLALGAALGVGGTSLACAPRVRALLGRAAQPLHDRAPGTFYAGLFVLSIGLFTRFEDGREIARWLLALR